MSSSSSSSSTSTAYHPRSHMPVSTITDNEPTSSSSSSPYTNFYYPDYPTSYSMQKVDSPVYQRPMESEEWRQPSAYAPDPPHAHHPMLSAHTYSYTLSPSSLPSSIANSLSGSSNGSYHSTPSSHPHSLSSSASASPQQQSATAHTQNNSTEDAAQHRHVDIQQQYNHGAYPDDSPLVGVGVGMSPMLPSPISSTLSPPMSALSTASHGSLSTALSSSGLSNVSSLSPIGSLSVDLAAQHLNDLGHGYHDHHHHGRSPAHISTSHSSLSHPQPGYSLHHHQGHEQGQVQGHSTPSTPLHGQEDSDTALNQAHPYAEAISPSYMQEFKAEDQQPEVCDPRYLTGTVHPGELHGDSGSGNDSGPPSPSVYSDSEGEENRLAYEEDDYTRMSNTRSTSFSSVSTTSRRSRTGTGRSRKGGLAFRRRNTAASNAAYAARKQVIATSTSMISGSDASSGSGRDGETETEAGMNVSTGMSSTGRAPSLRIDTSLAMRRRKMNESRVAENGREGGDVHCHRRDDNVGDRQVANEADQDDEEEEEEEYDYDDPRDGEYVYRDRSTAARMARASQQLQYPQQQQYDGYGTDITDPPNTAIGSMLDTSSGSSPVEMGISVGIRRRAATIHVPRGSEGYPYGHANDSSSENINESGVVEGDGGYLFDSRWEHTFGPSGSSDSNNSNSAYTHPSSSSAPQQSHSLRLLTSPMRTRAGTTVGGYLPTVRASQPHLYGSRYTPYPSPQSATHNHHHQQQSSTSSGYLSPPSYDNMGHGSMMVNNMGMRRLSYSSVTSISSSRSSTSTYPSTSPGTPLSPLTPMTPGISGSAGGQGYNEMQGGYTSSGGYSTMGGMGMDMMNSSNAGGALGSLGGISRRRSRPSNALPVPIPVPNLTKKSRGRRVPTVTSMEVASRRERWEGRKGAYV